MRSITLFFAFVVLSYSCTSIQGTTNTNSDAPSPHVVSIQCSPEAMSQVLNACSEIRSPQRCVFNDGVLFNDNRTVQLYYLQLCPAEVNRILESIHQQAGVKQVTIEKNF